jgi:hypothetical protein
MRGTQKHNGETRKADQYGRRSKGGWDDDIHFREPNAGGTQAIETRGCLAYDLERTPAEGSI